MMKVFAVRPGIVATALILLPSGLEAQPLARGAAPTESGVLARVGDQTITVDEFEEEMRRHSAGDPARFDTAEERRVLLDALLQRKAVVDSARAEGYLEHPEIVVALDRLLYNRYLNEELQKQLDALPEITMADVEAHYRDHADLYERPARSQGAIVFLEVSSRAEPSKRDEIRARAEALLREAERQAAQQPHFGDLARQISDDRASRYRGGVIGWLTDHPGATYRWDPAVVRALFAIPEVGGFAPVLETDEGFYLVRLVDRESSRPRPLEALADGIRRQLEKTRREQARTEFFEALLERRRPTVDEGLLSTLSAPDVAPQNPSQPPPASDGTPENRR